jgi:hypothetical protein
MTTMIMPMMPISITPKAHTIFRLSTSSQPRNTTPASVIIAQHSPAATNNIAIIKATSDGTVAQRANAQIVREADERGLPMGR